MFRLLEISFEGFESAFTCVTVCLLCRSNFRSYFEEKQIF